MSAHHEIRNIELSFAGLPSGFDGFRIAFVSDLHFYGKVGALEKAVLDSLNRQAVDVLLMGGDTVNKERYWPVAVEYLSGLRSDIEKYCVPGNWEYKRAGGFNVSRKWLERAGFEVLCNVRKTITRNGSQIDVVGLDDPRHGKPSEKPFFDASDFVVTLCHNPDILLEIDQKLFDLLLCGHTHGGQICLPFIGPLLTSTRIGRKFASGLHELANNRYVYITSGVGAGIPHTRIGCPAEIVFLTLRARMEDR